jgi:hypothetical protein
MRKRFPGHGTCYGVIKLDPRESLPFNYRVCYTDDDTELMSVTEALRHILPANACIPSNLREKLVALGAPLAPSDAGQLPNTPDQDQHSQPGSTPQQPQPTNITDPARRSARADARRRRRHAADLVRAANTAWTQGGVNMGHVNACGLSAITTVEVENIVRQLNLDILGVTKTWEGKCKPQDIPGYTFIGQPRQDQQGGGVGFYVSRTLGPITKAHFDTTVPESIWLEIDSHRRRERPLFVGCVYLPPAH